MRLLPGVAAALLTCAFAPAPAAVAAPGPTAPTSFRAALKPMNTGHGSGTVTIALHGSNAVITETVRGLAGRLGGKPYPHIQLLHVSGRGLCPAIRRADTNSDGIISDPEGTAAYGKVGATLSTRGDTSPAARTNTATAPKGTRFTYSRTIHLSSDAAASLKSGKAVIVVNGLDPKATPDRSVAARSPALCGTLLAVDGPGTAPGGPGAPTGPPPVRAIDRSRSR